MIKRLICAIRGHRSVLTDKTFYFRDGKRFLRETKRLVRCTRCGQTYFQPGIFQSDLIDLIKTTLQDTPKNEYENCI
jgi:hypothetical protein